jgi:CRISPR/Cas system-associated protein Csm6
MTENHNEEEAKTLTVKADQNLLKVMLRLNKIAKKKEYDQVLIDEARAILAKHMYKLFKKELKESHGINPDDITPLDIKIVNVSGKG